MGQSKFCFSIIISVLYKGFVDKGLETAASSRGVLTSPLTLKLGSPAFPYCLHSSPSLGNRCARHWLYKIFFCLKLEIFLLGVGGGVHTIFIMPIDDAILAR